MYGLLPDVDSEIGRKVVALRNSVDVLCQTRFVTSGRVAVDDSFIHGFVDKRNRRKQKLTADRLILTENRGAKLFDRCSKLAAIAAVDIFTFFVLSNSF